jgi:hypothetical protein
MMGLWLQQIEHSLGYGCDSKTLEVMISS